MARRPGCDSAAEDLRLAALAVERAEVTIIDARKAPRAVLSSRVRGGLATNSREALRISSVHPKGRPRSAPQNAFFPSTPKRSVRMPSAFGLPAEGRVSACPPTEELPSENRNTALGQRHRDGNQAPDRDYPRKSQLSVVQAKGPRPIPVPQRGSLSSNGRVAAVSENA